MGGYLDLINDWEVENQLPPPLPIIYSSVMKLKEPIEHLATINKINPVNKFKKLDVTLMAKNLISGIEEQSLSLGWMPEQLARLEKILLCFIPCKLEIVGTCSININMMHSDGGIRGSVVFHK